MVDKITSTFNFSLTEKFYLRVSITELTFHKKKMKSRVNILPDVIDFFLNCDSLMKNGIDIKGLVQEFRQSGNYEDFRHSCSLANISSTYALAGYTNISYSGTPDFIINGILAELKVIKQSDYSKRFDEKETDIFTSYLHEDICYDIGQAIRNRLAGAIKQSAKLVFIDLSVKSLVAIYSSKAFDSVKNIIPEPKKHRVIYYCKFGPNIFIGRKGVHSFFGTYVDFNPNIWTFMIQRKRKITHKRISGTTKITDNKETTIFET